MSADSIDAPVAAESAQRFAGEARRLHPLTILFGVLRGRPGIANLIVLAVALRITTDAYVVLIAIFFPLFILSSALFEWLKWSKFSWAVDADDVTIASGVVSKQQRVIPFDRIQDVSIEQGLLARLFGLAKVGFETGSASGEENEAKLDAIALADAEALRRHIRSHRAATVPTSEVAAPDAAAWPVAEDGEGRTLYAMALPRLVTAGVFNFSLAIFAVLFGLLNYLKDVLPFDPFDFDMYLDLSRSLGLDQWVLAHQWLSFVGGGIAVLLLGVATGIARTIIRDYGFTLDRTERGFRRRRGLTTKTDVTLPIARVQAATVGTGFIRRALGWYEVKLTSLAGDGKDEKDHIVAPLARLGEADAILSELALDRAALEDSRAMRQSWGRSHPVSVGFAPLVMLVIAALLFIAIALIPGALAARIDPPFDPRLIPLAPAAGALVVLFFNWLDWRHRRWHFDGRVLHIADGYLSRRHIILPARNVQSADLTLGPVLRRAGAVNLVLGVPGGSADISAIPLAEAEALRAQLLAAR